MTLLIIGVNYRASNLSIGCLRSLRNAAQPVPGVSVIPRKTDKETAL
jgi:hypothetical protein